MFATSTLFAQNSSLTKAWEKSYTSASNYTYPLKLGYHRTIINGPHSVFQFNKTGNGAVAIRKYNETTGVLEDSATYPISPMLGKDFFFDVPALNERKVKDDSTFPLLSHFKMALIATSGQNTNPYNKQQKKVIYFDPITFNVISQYSDSCAFVNPPDSIPRNSIFPVGGFSDRYLFLQNYHVWMTSPGYQTYTALCDTTNVGHPNPSNPFVEFYYQFSQHPTYVPYSQSGIAHYLTFDDSSSGISLLWYTNYKDPIDPLKKSILISPSVSGVGCYGTYGYEMSCDTCAVFEAEQIDRSWVREPIDTVVLVYKKQSANWPLADFHLRFVRKIKDSQGVCDSFAFYKDVLIGTLPNQGFSLTRCSDLWVTDNKIYVVMTQVNLVQVFCYDHNGNFLWLQQSLIGNNSTVASCVDNGGIYLGFKSGFMANPANHFQIVKYSEPNGAITLNYVDPTNKGMITDMKLNDWNSSIFVTGVDQSVGYQTKTVRYNLGPNDVPDTKSTEFSIYPNPAHDLIKIRANHGLEGQTYTISDISGRTLYRGTIFSQRTTISIKELSTGTYILKITGSAQAHKLIKQ